MKKDLVDFVIKCLTCQQVKVEHIHVAGLVHSTWAELAYSPSKASTFKMGFKEEEPAIIHVIQAKHELA